MIWALVLIAIAVSERLWFDLGPNVELVTTASVLSGMYLSGRYKWLVPLTVMWLSDLVLGVGWISFFVWSGFLVTAYLPGWLARWVPGELVQGVGAGVLGNLGFFWWTNFGVWVTDRWGMYSRDGAGLVAALVAGLPFLKVQMMSTLLFLPLALIVVMEVKKWIRQEVGKEEFWLRVWSYKFMRSC